MDLIPLEPFGVEVRDLDLSKLLGDREAASLRAALDEGLLLLLRNQHISDEDHLRVVEGMIPGLVATPDDRRLAQPVTFLSNTGHTDLKDSILTFHADYSFSTKPDELISLYGYDVDDGASPTEFASSELGLVALPAKLRERLGAQHRHH